MPKKSQKPAPEPEVDEDEIDEEEEVEEEDEVDEEEVEEEEDEDGDSPKQSKKQKGQPGKLVPREPVKVPTAVLKTASKEVRLLLKEREELQAKGDKKGLRKLRAKLRAQGFRLSDLVGQS